MLLSKLNGLVHAILTDFELCATRFPRNRRLITDRSLRKIMLLTIILVKEIGLFEKQ